MPELLNVQQGLDNLRQGTPKLSPLQRTLQATNSKPIEVEQGTNNAQSRLEQNFRQDLEQQAKHEALAADGLNIPGGDRIKSLAAFGADFFMHPVRHESGS